MSRGLKSVRQPSSCRSDRGGGKGQPRSVIGWTKQQELAAIAAGAGVGSEKREKVEKAAARNHATFWTCGCGRRHRIRYEQAKRLVLCCPCCYETFGG